MQMQGLMLRDVKKTSMVCRMQVGRPHSNSASHARFRSPSPPAPPASSRFHFRLTDARRDEPRLELSSLSNSTRMGPLAVSVVLGVEGCEDRIDYRWDNRFQMKSPRHRCGRGFTLYFLWDHLGCNQTVLRKGRSPSLSPVYSMHTTEYWGVTVTRHFRFPTPKSKFLCNRSYPLWSAYRSRSLPAPFEP